MEMHRFTMEPFDSRETGSAVYRQAKRREQLRREQPKSGMGSVYRQTALCALIVALLIVLELFVFQKEAETVPASAPTQEPRSALSAAETEGEGEEDSLGKLQFVSGRVYSVFASDARWALPLAPNEIGTSADGKLLLLQAEAGTAVRVAAAGQVVSVGSDERYGTAVRVYHGKERESIYYGLGGIAVEEGQPLLAGDGLGVVSDTELVCVAVLQDGAPIAAGECFDIEPLAVT